MITSYRIVKKKLLSSAFSGEGAKKYGGRWNNKGFSCIYLAGSESLAILEILVHLDNQEILSEYALFSVEITDELILQLDKNSYPKNWRAEPAPSETASIGDSWLRSLASPVLEVPSVIVPRESNYILNPLHPDYMNITKKTKRLDFVIDERLIQKNNYNK